MRVWEALNARRTLIIVIVIGAGALWLPFLNRSLWLDETGTYWIISGSLAETIERATRFQGQSPLFFLIESLALAIGGRSEIVLRCPSVLFMAVAALVLYRLATLLMDRNAALIAPVVFVTSWKVVAEANDARPYAMATLLVVGAMCAAIRWFSTGKFRYAAIYVLCAAATVYAHYLFGVMFLVHLVFAVEARRSGAEVSTKAIIAAALAVLFLLLPLVPQFLALIAKRGTYSWAGTPSLRQLLIAVIPPVTVAGLAVGLVFARVTTGARVHWQRSRPPWFLLAWLFIPIGVLFGISKFTTTKIFSPQYVMAAEPAVALLAAWYLRTLRPTAGRVVIAVCLVAVTFVAIRVRPIVHEDWRGAIAEINALGSQEPVAVMCDCGFVEAKNINWLTDTNRRKFLNAPLAAYPPKGAVLRLPARVFSPELREYAERELGQFATKHVRIAFLGRGSVARTWRPWLESRLRPMGFETRRLGEHPGVSLLLFERSVPTGESGRSALPESNSAEEGTRTP